MRGFRQEVARFQRLIAVVKQTEEEVKNHGLTRQTARGCGSRCLANCGKTPA